MMTPSLRRIRARNQRVGAVVRSLWHHIGAVVRSLWGGVEAFGFWAAVFLPLTYPAVLISGGGRFWIALVGLLAAHVLALVIGRGHGRRESEE